VQRIDGQRSIAAILDEFRAADPNLSPEKAAEAFNALYRLLNSLNLLFLTDRRD
jgi:hypothetical protein